MEYKINLIEYDTFINYIYPNMYNDIITINYHTPDSYILIVPEDMIEDVIQMCAYKLMEIGLNTNYEPNQIGLCIEHLIDVFNRCI